LKPLLKKKKKRGSHKKRGTYRKITVAESTSIKRESSVVGKRTLPEGPSYQRRAKKAGRFVGERSRNEVSLEKTRGQVKGPQKNPGPGREGKGRPALEEFPPERRKVSKRGGTNDHPTPRGAYPKKKRDVLLAKEDI